MTSAASCGRGGEPTADPVKLGRDQRVAARVPVPAAEQRCHPGFPPVGSQTVQVTVLVM